MSRWLDFNLILIADMHIKRSWRNIKRKWKDLVSDWRGMIGFLSGDYR